MHGVYLLWLVQERGFAPALIASILAAGDVCVFALEVPTGWFADRFGYRLSLMIGSALQVCGMVAFWQAAAAPELLLASLLVAAGDTFRSGADQALFYRTCAVLGVEAEFQTRQARTDAAGHASLVGLLLLGGAIVGVAGYTAAWLLEVGLCSAGFVLACLMVEPPAGALDDSNGEPEDDQRGRPSRAASRVWTIASLIVPTAFLDGAAGAAAFLAQTSDDASLAGVTGLVAAITLAEAAGAWLAARAWRNDGRQFGLLACGAAVLAVPLLFVAGAAIAAVALAVVLGLILPLRAAALQGAASDGVRARIASLASACDMACSTLMLLAAGAWSTRRRTR